MLRGLERVARGVSMLIRFLCVVVQWTLGLHRNATMARRSISCYFREQGCADVYSSIFYDLPLRLCAVFFCIPFDLSVERGERREVQR